jgi:hypothetical protein
MDERYKLNTSSNPPRSNFNLAMDERYKLNTSTSSNTDKILEQIDKLNEDIVAIKNEMKKSNEYQLYLQIQENKKQHELNELTKLINESFKQKYLKYKQKYLQLKNRNKI